jgi:hypothetical protein
LALRQITSAPPEPHPFRLSPFDSPIYPPVLSITARELQDRLQSANPPTLLHVLPPEVFATAQFPGSKNACVYETAFPVHIRALGLDPSAALVVYGAGEGSLDAVTATEELRAARTSSPSKVNWPNGKPPACRSKAPASSRSPPSPMALPARHRAREWGRSKGRVKG